MISSPAPLNLQESREAAVERGWKVLIILIWLCVPVAAYFMISEDQLDYELELERQVQYCEEQRAHLDTYSSLFQVQAAAVHSIDTSAELMVWRREWSMLTEDEAVAAAHMTGARLDFYPQTAARLADLQRELAEQSSAIGEAARLREQYIRSADHLSSIAQRIDNARGMAEYYRRLGAQAIYLLIMEDLAILEARYRDHRNSRYDMLADAEAELLHADGLNRRISMQLVDLVDVIERDRQTSYAEKLSQRFGSFNLRAELDALISGAKPAAASS